MGLTQSETHEKGLKSQYINQGTKIKFSEVFRDVCLSRIPIYKVSC